MYYQWAAVVKFNPNVFILAKNESAWKMNCSNMADFKYTSLVY